MERVLALSSLVVMSLPLFAIQTAAKTLEVVGTGDGMEIVRAIGAAYMQKFPDAKIVVPPSIGSGGGIAAVGSGKAVLARVARPLKEGEIEAGLQAQSVFRLPTAIYTHLDIKLDGISHESLAGIYEGTITNWKKLGGPDLRIKVVRREDTDSSLTVLRKSMPWWSDLELTSRSKIAVTTQDAVETVRQTPGAIGFGPYSTALESALNVLDIEGIAPNNAAYPSAVSVAYVWRQGVLAKEAGRFIEFSTLPSTKALIAALGAIPATGN